MKKIITTLASAVCLLCATSAHAGLYKLDFQAKDFRDQFNPGPAPQSEVAGSIIFTAMSLGSPVTSIDKIDLTILNHTYTVDEVVEAQYPQYLQIYVFGGSITGGATGIGSGTNDFWLSLNPSTAAGYILYTAVGERGIWQSRITATFTELTTDVPEPGSMSLLLAGAGGLCAMLRRRRRQA